MNDHMKPTKSRSYPRDVWVPAAIRSILSHVSYLGLVPTPNGPIPGKHPALIDKKVWDRCREVFKLNQRRTSKIWTRTRHVYPLTPLLRCGRCGGPVHGQKRQLAAGQKIYYVCAASRRYLRFGRTKPECDLPWLRGAGLQQALLAELRALAVRPTVSAALRKGLKTARSPEEDYRETLGKLDERAARIAKRFDWGHIDEVEYLRCVGEVNLEKQSVREQLVQKHKSFNLNQWETLFAGIVAYVVAERTNQQPWTVLGETAKERTARGGHGWDTKATADEIEFALWADRLPEFLERLEVDVAADGSVSLAVVPRPEWVRYFRVRVNELDGSFFSKG
jgi:hypothetical protein